MQISKKTKWDQECQSNATSKIKVGYGDDDGTDECRVIQLRLVCRTLQNGDKRHSRDVTHCGMVEVML
jgi:hypothetical protein